jgi:hypothetical protein
MPVVIHSEVLFMPESMREAGFFVPSGLEIVDPTNQISERLLELQPFENFRRVEEGTNIELLSGDEDIVLRIEGSASIVPFQGWRVKEIVQVDGSNPMINKLGVVQYESTPAGMTVVYERIPATSMAGGRVRIHAENDEQLQYQSVPDFEAVPQVLAEIDEGSELVNIIEAFAEVARSGELDLEGIREPLLQWSDYLARQPYGNGFVAGHSPSGYHSLTSLADGYKLECEGRASTSVDLMSLSGLVSVHQVGNFYSDIEGMLVSNDVGHANSSVLLPDGTWMDTDFATFRGLDDNDPNQIYAGEMQLSENEIIEMLKEFRQDRHRELIASQRMNADFDLAVKYGIPAVGAILLAASGLYVYGRYRPKLKRMLSNLNLKRDKSAEGGVGAVDKSELGDVVADGGEKNFVAANPTIESPGEYTSTISEKQNLKDIEARTVEEEREVYPLELVLAAALAFEFATNPDFEQQDYAKDYFGKIVDILADYNEELDSALKYCLEYESATYNEFKKYFPENALTQVQYDSVRFASELVRRDNILRKLVECRDVYLSTKHQMSQRSYDFRARAQFLDEVIRKHADDSGLRSASLRLLQGYLLR